MKYRGRPLSPRGELIAVGVIVFGLALMGADGDNWYFYVVALVGLGTAVVRYGRRLEKQRGEANGRPPA